jgi:predicted dehydrogenase
VSTLRVGISGCTDAAKVIVQAARAHRDCEVVAAHDEHGPTLTTWQRELGLGFATTQFEALLGSGVDFVVLCGDPKKRRQQVEAAAAQSVPCLLRGPLAQDLADATAMVSAADAAGVKLGVMVDGQQDPVFEQLRRMLAADWLGGIVAISAMTGDDAWLSRGERQPPSPFFERIVGDVALCSWLCGRSVVRVTAQQVRTIAAGGADTAVATALLQGNIAATFVGSQVTAVRALAVHGTDGGVRIAGDRIWLLGKREFAGQIFDYPTPGHPIVLSREELRPALRQLEPLAEPLGRFARWLDDCDDFPCPGEQALADLRVAAAMERATLSARAEDV